jgi:hypothetical protein
MGRGLVEMDGQKQRKKGRKMAMAGKKGGLFWRNGQMKEGERENCPFAKTFKKLAKFLCNLFRKINL